MRWAAVVVAVCGCWGPSSGLGMEPEPTPYVAFVVVDQAEVRCGPGREFYATAELRRGEKVEVYRRDADGWLAIRPPVGSFSWVAARLVARTEDSQVGRVRSDDAVGWVGCGLGKQVNHRWQVRLKLGELLEVLGQAKLAPFPGAPEELFLQISPPAGEFRWVYGKQVASSRELARLSEVVNAERARIADLQVVVEPNGRSNIDRLHDVTDRLRQRVQPAAAAKEVEMRVVAARDGGAKRRPARGGSTTDKIEEPTPLEPDANESELPASDANEEVSSESGSSESESTEPDSESGDEAADDAGDAMSEEASTAEDEVAAFLAPVASAKSSNAKSVDAEDAAGTPVGPPPTDVLDLEIQLTQMVARDPRQWRLAPLRQAAQTFATTGAPEERQRARSALARIEEFAQLQAKHNGTSMTPHIPIGMANVRPASAVTGAATGSADGVGYTGSGWLMPVHSTKRPAPPYALIDRAGNLVCYVTPLPGMNLGQYERTEIGVFGQKGSIPALKASHITVQRVVSLSRHQKAK